MATQLLFYDQVQTLNGQRHRDWYVKTGGSFEFARDVNAVPLLAVEFPSAVNEYPIVFTGSDDEVIPVAVMGIRNQENLYVDEAGEWQAKYVPAFVRRYPFVFSSSEDGSTLTLCIDENYSGCNQEGRGERLFDSEGNQTQYLTGVLEFQKQYQASFQQTVKFCSKLVELDVLEPLSATFTPADGEPAVLSGFSAVNRDKLKALPDEKLVELAKSDELELLYTHLVSMANFQQMSDRIGAQGSRPDSNDEAVNAAESKSEPNDDSASSTTASQDAD